jgi:hypothetical protein
MRFGVLTAATMEITGFWDEPSSKLHAVAFQKIILHYLTLLIIVSLLAYCASPG